MIEERKPPPAAHATARTLLHTLMRTYGWTALLFTDTDADWRFLPEQGGVLGAERRLTEFLPTIPAPLVELAKHESSVWGCLTLWGDKSPLLDVWFNPTRCCVEWVMAVRLRQPPDTLARWMSPDTLTAGAALLLDTLLRLHAPILVVGRQAAALRWLRALAWQHDGLLGVLDRRGETGLYPYRCIHLLRSAFPTIEDGLRDIQSFPITRLLLSDLLDVQPETLLNHTIIPWIGALPADEDGAAYLRAALPLPSPDWSHAVAPSHRPVVGGALVEVDERGRIEAIRWLELDGSSVTLFNRRLETLRDTGALIRMPETLLPMIAVGDRARFFTASAGSSRREIAAQSVPRPRLTPLPTDGTPPSAFQPPPHSDMLEERLLFARHFLSRLFVEDNPVAACLAALDTIEGQPLSWDERCDLLHALYGVQAFEPLLLASGSLLIHGQTDVRVLEGDSLLAPIIQRRIANVNDLVALLQYLLNVRVFGVSAEALFEQTLAQSRALRWGLRDKGGELNCALHVPPATLSPLTLWIQPGLPALDDDIFTPEMAELLAAVMRTGMPLLITSVDRRLAAALLARCGAWLPEDARIVIAQTEADALDLPQPQVIALSSVALPPLVHHQPAALPTAKAVLRTALAALPDALLLHTLTPDLAADYLDSLLAFRATAATMPAASPADALRRLAFWVRRRYVRVSLPEVQARIMAYVPLIAHILRDSDGQVRVSLADVGAMKHPDEPIPYLFRYDSQGDDRRIVRDQLTFSRRDQLQPWIEP